MDKKTQKKTGIKPSKAKDFSIENQPSSEAKKAGWERRRNAQEMMDMIMRNQNMTVGELQEYVSNNQKSMTIKEQITIKYIQGIMKDNRMLLDWLDRHISKAPNNIELTGKDGEEIKNITINVIGNGSTI